MNALLSIPFPVLTLFAALGALVMVAIVVIATRRGAKWQRHQQEIVEAYQQGAKDATAWDLPLTRTPRGGQGA